MQQARVRADQVPASPPRLRRVGVLIPILGDLRWVWLLVRPRHLSPTRSTGSSERPAAESRDPPLHPVPVRGPSSVRKRWRGPRPRDGHESPPRRQGYEGAGGWTASVGPANEVLEPALLHWLDTRSRLEEGEVRQPDCSSRWAAPTVRSPSALRQQLADRSGLGIPRFGVERDGGEGRTRGGRGAA